VAVKTPTRTLVRTALVAFALGIGMSAACEQKKTNSPDDGAKKDDGGNLCTEYATCDACIDGLVASGDSEGAAETQCGAAVLGCWTTWEKPIVCHGKEHKEKPKS
jgi:hypothetical protein